MGSRSCATDLDFSTAVKIGRYMPKIRTSSNYMIAVVTIYVCGFHLSKYYSHQVIVSGVWPRKYP